RIARKSSLLPVYPGTRRAGQRSATPLTGRASKAANEPSGVSICLTLTPGGRVRKRGVLTKNPPPCSVESVGSVAYRGHAAGAVLRARPAAGDAAAVRSGASAGLRGYAARMGCA